MFTIAVNEIGKAYHKEFSIDHCKEYYKLLAQYFFNDPKFKGELNKGLLIRGDIGRGKSVGIQMFSMQSPVKEYWFQLRQFEYVNALKLQHDFMQNGWEVFDKLTQNIKAHQKQNMIDSWRGLCIDDVGTERKAVNQYGNTVNIVEELLLRRYEMFQRDGIITHITTNLSPTKLQEAYGERVRSRLVEMCNDVIVRGVDLRRNL